MARGALAAYPCFGGAAATAAAAWYARTAAAIELPDGRGSGVPPRAADDDDDDYNAAAAAVSLGHAHTANDNRRRAPPSRIDIARPRGIRAFMVFARHGPLGSPFEDESLASCCLCEKSHLLIDNIARTTV